MELEKAYNVKELFEELKKDGVAEAEIVCKKVVVKLCEFLRESAKISKDGFIGKFDDLAIPVINSFEKIALEKLDHIDGELVEVVTFEEVVEVKPE